jgi:hypothetical protein
MDQRLVGSVQIVRSFHEHTSAVSHDPADRDFHVIDPERRVHLIDRGNAGGKPLDRAPGTVPPDQTVSTVASLGLLAPIEASGPHREHLANDRLFSADRLSFVALSPVSAR